MKKEVIFLPIKPEFSRKILDCTKLWEYRKVVPSKEISHFVLYSSTPEKKVRAIVEVKSIFSGSPSEVWEKTKDASGVLEDFYFT
jgi:predicted transcriptional regulator